MEQTKDHQQSFSYWKSMDHSNRHQRNNHMQTTLKIIFNKQDPVKLEEPQGNAQSNLMKSEKQYVIKTRIFT